jgi:hypothetical protein
VTPGMQIRLWLRDAARSQVALTLAAVAAVVALLIASVSQTGTRDGSQDALSGGSETTGQLDGSASGTGGSSTGAGSTSGGAGATGTSSTGGSSTGGSALGGTGASGGTGSAVGTGSSGGTGSSTTTGGSSTSGAGTGGSSGTSGTQGFDITRSTDRGINNCDGGPKTCVKLGFLIAKIGGLDASGFALNLRSDITTVIQDYIDYQNKHGGLNGRTIVPVFRSVDPVEDDDQKKACTELTQDKKVFAVIDTAALIFADSQTCFIRDNKTPLLHGYAESEAFMDAGKGYDVSETRSLDRIAIEWADEIGKLKFLKGGEHVGILEDNCEPSHSVVQKFLIGGIAKYKPASVKTYESDCTAASAQAQPPALQQQMCIDGVTHVLLATSFVAAQTFLQSADGGPCGAGPKKYKYMASDYSLLAGDLFTRNFSKTQFDGSLAISNEFTGITAVSPQTRFCSGILKAAGEPGVDNTYSNADATAFCDYFFLFVKAAQKVGPDLTRAKWAQAVQTLGEFDGSYSPKSVFQPGKTNGGELVHAMVWHADCTCYRQTGPLHVGLG